MTAVSVPDASGNGRSCYVKQGLRGSIDFPIVGAAVAQFDGAVRVAYTAVDRSRCGRPIWRPPSRDES